MENKWWIVVAILALVVGYFVGGAFVQPEIQKETVYINNTETVTVEVAPSLDNPILDFLEEMDDQEDVFCDRDEYDIEEVTVKKVYDEYTVSYDKDTTEFDFNVKLKFDNGDDRCYDKYDVSVLYEEGEDPVINY